MIALGYRSPLRPLPWDVISSCSALYNLLQAENHAEVLTANSDLRPNDINLELHSCDGEWTSYSCKESSWWQEAIRYADCIESLGNASQFSKLVCTHLSYFVMMIVFVIFLYIFRSFSFHFHFSPSIHLNPWLLFEGTVYWLLVVQTPLLYQNSFFFFFFPV